MVPLVIRVSVRCRELPGSASGSRIAATEGHGGPASGASGLRLRPAAALFAFPDGNRALPSTGYLCSTGPSDTPRRPDLPPVTERFLRGVPRSV